MSAPKIAITHASSLLAEALLASMTESGILPDSVILLDETEQAGSRLAFGNTYITVQDQYEHDYEDLAAVLLLQADRELESLLKHADCYVFSHHPDEQAAAPMDFRRLEGVSFADVDSTTVKLAGPEFSTLLTALRPLQALSPLNAVQVVNILSASVQGKSAVEELASQTISLLNSREVEPGLFPVQLAFNMIPQSAPELAGDHLAGLLASENTRCSVQNLMVAAFHGVAISAHLEFTEAVDLATVRTVLAESEGVRMTDTPVSPITDCNTGSDIFVYALSQPQKDAKRLQFWIIADSVRNGLVKNYLNAIQFLLKSFL